MHTELPRRPALIAFILLQDSENEAFFELAHGFGIKNIAFVHLHDERFELISHGFSLSWEKQLILLFSMYSIPFALPLQPAGYFACRSCSWRTKSRPW